MITPILVKLFSNMLLEDSYSEIPKISKMAFIYKKSSRKNPKNCRPTLSKICEKLLVSGVTQFLKGFRLVDSYQYGFLKSCGYRLYRKLTKIGG